VIGGEPVSIFDTLRVVKRLIDSGALVARTATARDRSPGGGGDAGESVGGAARAPQSGAQIPVARHDPAARYGDAVCGGRAPENDRRKSLRRTPVPFEKPAAKPAPAPIPPGDEKEPVGRFRGWRAPPPRRSPA